MTPRCHAPAGFRVPGPDLPPVPRMTAGSAPTAHPSKAGALYKCKRVPSGGIASRGGLLACDMSLLRWTNRAITCDPAEVSVMDPMLVVRRHVDLLRVRSAICRHAR